MENSKKHDRIKKYAEIFEAYALLDEYRKKQPTLDEASVRLEQYKGRVKNLGDTVDIKDEVGLVEVVNKIDHAELKIKNLGNDVFRKLEDSMVLWIDEKINEVAQSKEEAMAVKKFFDDGGRDQEMLIEIVQEVESTETKKENKLDQMFLKIMDGLDALIKEINNVLDSIDQALAEIEGKNSPVKITTEEPVVTTTLDENNIEQTVNAQAAGQEKESVLDVVENSEPVKLTMADIESIEASVMQEGKDESVDLAKMGSLFATFNEDPKTNQSSTMVKRQ